MSTESPKPRSRPIAAVMFKLPLMIDCATFETFMLDYFEDKLPWRQKMVFNMHLRLCRECRDYLENYQSAIHLAASQKDVLFSEMDMGEVPEDLITAIIKAQQK